MRNVHDDVAQSEEGLGVERLREEVGQVVVRGDEGHTQLVLLDALAHVEVSTSDVLRLRMVLRVVREVARGLVVQVQVHGRVVVRVELAEEGAQVDRLLGHLLSPLTPP